MTEHRLETQPDKPPRRPSLAQALGLLAFAIMLALLRWLEHSWRLGRGDYIGIGLHHTWYWYTVIWGLRIAAAGWLLWLLWRWWRR